jgi:hypothetical protein
MSDYDLRSDLLSVIGLVPTSETTDATITAQDLESTTNLNFKSLTIEIYIGVGGITFDGSNYIEVKIQHSDDNFTTTVACTADDLILDYTTSVTNALPDANGTVKSLKAAHAAAENFLVGYRGKKRYVRVLFDFTGTHGTGTVLGCNWLFSHPMSKPVWTVGPSKQTIPDLV